MTARFACALLLTLGASNMLHAQQGFELHVHDSAVIRPGSAAIETHSIYLQQDARTAGDGSALPQHGFYETVELMQGITPSLQFSLYNFTTLQPGHPLQWTGASIRPQIRVPDRWRWPVHASLSVEAGYQRPRFTPDTWSLEILPVLDKTLGRWYLSINPALERTVHGPATRAGLEFTPAAKATFRFSPKAAAGLEYFANFGRLTRIATLRDQEQMAAPVLDLHPSPRWSIEWALGIGATRATDHFITMFIVERQFDWRRPKR